MHLAPQGPPGRPSGNLIRSNGGPLGESWIDKRCPRCEFGGKSWADFNDFIFHFFRFVEGPERVLGACSGAKEAHRGVPREPINFFLGPKGGPILKRPSLIRSEPDRAGSEQGSEVPGEEQRSKIYKVTIPGQGLARPGPLARRMICIVFGKGP